MLCAEGGVAMTAIDEQGARQWRNEHRTMTVRSRRTADVSETGGDLVATLQQRRQVLGQFVQSLAKADRPACTTGSGWSQSRLYPDRSSLVLTDGDQAQWEVPAAAFLPEERAGAASFVLATGGTKVDRLMQWLGARGRSLRTAGSHKGQSIAGMAGTGSHGSMLGETGFEEHVKGILLSTGPGRAVWLADPARPVLDPAWVSQFAEIGDPAHFHHALLHLGGLGYVSALLIEGRETFWLETARRIAPLPQATLQAIAGGNHAAILDGWHEGRDLAFVELTLDPRKGLSREIMQTVHVHTSAPPPGLKSMHHVPDHPLSMLRAALNEGVTEAKDLGLKLNLINVPDLTYRDFKPTSGLEGPFTLDKLTAVWKPHRLLIFRIDVYNAAIGVRLADLPAALEAGFAIARRFRPHFVYTVRFARQSPASLSILRHEQNAVINLDGLGKKFFLGSDADKAARAFTAELRKRGIAYAMHWGKDAPSTKTKILADYPDAVTGWKRARAALLDPATAAAFVSPALRNWGLV